MTQIKTIQGNIAGVKQAFDNPPASINAFPCFVNFIGPGKPTYNMKLVLLRHTVKMCLYVSKQTTPETEARLRPFVDLVLDAFDVKNSLNSTCNDSEVTAYEPGVLSYGGHQYAGIVFTIEINENEARTYA